MLKPVWGSAKRKGRYGRGGGSRTGGRHRPLSAGRPGRRSWHEIVSRTRDELAKSGCCLLPDFIRPALQDALRTECAAIAPSAHYDVETVNAYNIDVGTPLPDGHPGRITVQRGNAFVARDRIPADAIINRLYSSGPFQRFVASCFGLPRVHELGDPLSGLVLNVVNPGMQHPWHFDTNEFTVSLLTQEADGGGVFEYCPNIRTAERENLGDVRDVLTGRGGRLVQRLTLRPGDLQLFKGRYSLHRVSTVRGTRRGTRRSSPTASARGHRQRRAHEAALRSRPARAPGGGGARRPGRPVAGLGEAVSCASTRQERSRSTTSTPSPTHAPTSARSATSTTTSRNWRNRTSSGSSPNTGRRAGSPSRPCSTSAARTASTRRW